MAKYLISTVETYRVDSEEEAKQLIESTRENTIGVLSKYSSVHKEQKQKGEIVDEWYRVTLTQSFSSEKEPDSRTIINYERE